jgi:purine-binding chemotaxis protein CheW
MTDVLEAEMLEEDTQKGRYLTFALDNEFYGVEIRYITEIIGLQPITAVPELPKFICGIINLRGKIIPVMDVRLRFHKSFREYDDRTCVIIIDLMNLTMGMIVDSVEEVLSIPDSEIVDPSEVSMAINRFIKGIGKVNNEVKLLLDCSKLLSVEDIEKISI